MGKIFLTQGCDMQTKKEIKRKESGTAVKTMGVCISPKGTMNAEFVFRLKYGIAWAVVTNKGSLKILTQSNPSVECL